MANIPTMANRYHFAAYENPRGELTAEIKSKREPLEESICGRIRREYGERSGGVVYLIGVFDLVDGVRGIQRKRSKRSNRGRSVDRAIARREGTRARTDYLDPFSIDRDSSLW